ncbi:hypothetical protein CY34DRAFT_811835 [Suillus luteus UH-Slu-Lm8-n1]|uniref:Unplaced genomic scaffold CY34scaffold_451, whole genome shotgun sequence n=1 Tax=Suillus luteus UH-Slu-Lm8-n1 TaxID=930992 RepID=A0A0D0ANJ0_9AGAM|nr:hypothetical protein CY34DRAFT_811835 [Suillus luteus UH-Slu-Lm8-n1]
MYSHFTKSASLRHSPIRSTSFLSVEKDTPKPCQCSQFLCACASTGGEWCRPQTDLHLLIHPPQSDARSSLKFEMHVHHHFLLHMIISSSDFIFILVICLEEGIASLAREYSTLASASSRYVFPFPRDIHACNDRQRRLITATQKPIQRRIEPASVLQLPSV